MDKQPKALSLADWLDEVNAVAHPIHTKSAAEELRRLHSELERMTELAGLQSSRARDYAGAFMRQKNLNAELLVALRACAEWMESTRVSGDAGNWDWAKGDVYTKAMAVIARATGEQP